MINFLEIAAILVLLLTLIVKELVRAYNGPKINLWLKRLNLAIIPLLILFGFIIVIRLIQLFWRLFFHSFSVVQSLLFLKPPIDKKTQQILSPHSNKQAGCWKAYSSILFWVRAFSPGRWSWGSIRSRLEQAFIRRNHWCFGRFTEFTQDLCTTQAGFSNLISERTSAWGRRQFLPVKSKGNDNHENKKSN